MIVDCAVYAKGERRPGKVDLDDALEAGRGGDDTFVWIGLHDPEPGEFDAVAEEFELHPLAVEDAIKAHQRAKLERYGDCLFLVLKTARYDDDAEVVEFAEIQLFAGQGFVITVRHGLASALGPVRHALEADPERLALGPAAVVHAILDRVVDDYLPVLDGLDHDIVEIENQVFSPERTNPAERIYKLKRQVLDLYRNVEPLIDPLERLQTGQHSFGTVGDLGHYFRDIYDHLQRAVSRIKLQQELLSEVLNVNLTHISVQQNEDMRRISGWVAIAAVPTLLAGLWGMNFTHMPELDEWWGYPLALTTMGSVSLFLYRWLRKQ
ncbi:MAG TPA: magnesium and cobalt transport protein CorA, partial [Acidimicrobiales bacterium]|nr:magnesium and cobalt transport protein CorA [Acidimicrobiales bacterium]